MILKEKVARHTFQTKSRFKEESVESQRNRKVISIFDMLWNRWTVIVLEAKNDNRRVHVFNQLQLFRIGHRAKCMQNII